LLHDAGILILARHFPQAYDEVLDLMINEHYLMPLAEQRVLGVNHAEVGAYLIGLWGLPAVVVESIQYHHNPSESPQGIAGMTATAAVHLADGFYATSSQHPAFRDSVMDPALVNAPWLSGRLESLRSGLSEP